MSTDRLLAAADSLVAALGTAGLGSVLNGGVTIAWQDDPVQELADTDLTNWLLWVVDAGEKVLTDRDSVPIEEYELLLLVQKKVPANTSPADRQTLCRAGSALVATIRQFCRKTTIAVDGSGAVCFAVEREVARNFEVYTEDGLYRAPLVTHWRAAFDDP